MIGRAAAGEMVVNAAEKADTNLVESHTGKEAATGMGETVEDVAVPVELEDAVDVAVADAVDFEAAAVVAVEVAIHAAVVEGRRFAREMGRQSAKSVPKEDRPVGHHCCP